MSQVIKRKFIPKSTTKENKKLIRNEMLSFYNAKDYKNAKNRLDAMKIDANAGNGGLPYKNVSDYRKGTYLVDAGCMRVYYYDQAKFLSKIYGKKNVDKWSGHKIHETYKHLIGREYASMISESKKKKITK